MDQCVDISAMESFFKSRVVKGRKFLTAAVSANQNLISLARTCATWNDVADWLTKYGRVRRQAKRTEPINWRSLSVIAGRMGGCVGEAGASKAADWKRLVTELENHCAQLALAENGLSAQGGWMNDVKQKHLPINQPVPSSHQPTSKAEPYQRPANGVDQQKLNSRPRIGRRGFGSAIKPGEICPPSSPTRADSG
jgi:hypothetical protein